ncbi:hypothetical protein WN55_07197 [Dufourea novaeangliae]|uniref:Uncharacterized protein n=1 Tax=Dufourea novaeangliae TaxID=178035 RepID=A0A154PT80_DUFNO|nr:hypothetical protein WN55_07197 [Dufourea novaeangliae]
MRGFYRQFSKFVVLRALRRPTIFPLLSREANNIYAVRTRVIAREDYSGNTKTHPSRESASSSSVDLIISRQRKHVNKYIQ